MTTFYMGEGGIVPEAVYTDMNTVINKKLGTSAVYAPDEWADIVKDFAPLPEKTASGTIATFPDGADLVPLKSLSLTVTPSQSGTGDPSPTNPRPLNSFSSLALAHTGANIIPSSKVCITVSRNDLIFEKAVQVKKGTTYSCSISNVQYATNWRFAFRFYDGQGNNITNAITNGYVTFTPALADTYDSGKTVMQGAVSTTTSLKMEVLKDCYVTVGITSGDVSGSTTLDYQLEVGSTPSTYSAYEGDPHTLDLGSTVYGLTGDCVTGELSTSYKLADLSSMDWDSGSPNQDGYIRFVNHSAWVDKANGYRLFCDKFPVKTSLVPSSPTTIGISGYSSNKNIYIAVESNMLTGDLSTNAGRNTAFRNWISENGLQILYELATPTALTIDPVEIESFKGVNNIWCTQDNSSVTVEYRADIELSLQ